MKSEGNFFVNSINHPQHNKNLIVKKRFSFVFWRRKKVYICTFFTKNNWRTTCNNFDNITFTCVLVEKFNLVCNFKVNAFYPFFFYKIYENGKTRIYFTSTFNINQVKVTFKRKICILIDWALQFLCYFFKNIDFGL